MYLELVTARLKKAQYKVRSHIWTGNDTACKLYSTGGLNKSRYHIVGATPYEICKMCKHNQQKLGRSKDSEVDDLLLMEWI